ncbi:MULTISPECIES: response regulator [Spirulina sp. CCY15215]|uniref:response regulator n=1 Tax=Spirulina sp. CCY15215 TaxID=2767591 RepID=UPI0019510424|nr:response regulator [Spirulina major]
MNPKLLVIDDDDGVREIIQISLEAVAGWDVLTAASGKEGLAIAQREQPDGIILDVMMPDMDGMETYKQLQANPQTHQIPTILLTAKAKMSEKEQFINLGVAGVITKPFEAINLVAQISKIFQW